MISRRVLELLIQYVGNGESNGRQSSRFHVPPHTSKLESVA
jgi:hypothetical protein